MILGGLGAAALSYIAWRDSDWGTTSAAGTIRAVVPAALGLVLGSLTILGSFFLSILGMRRAPAPYNPPELPTPQPPTRRTR